MTRTSLMILVATGTAHAAEPAMPQLAPHGTMPSRHVAHIYYNFATGEKIATLLGDVRPVSEQISPRVWVADNALPCADFGDTGWVNGLLDDPNCTTCNTSTATRRTFLDWGDIPTDTVIDCVGISWSTCILDENANGDYIGDGVEGFAATWTWYDAENGFDSSATRLPLIGFTLTNLPGSARGDLRCEFLWRYTATIDLAASLSSSLVFEVGDTDLVDDSGTGYYNPGAGADLDADGLADFGYSMRYTLPGTVDFDGDGVVDGVGGDALGDEPLTGWLLVTGDGQVSDDGSTYTPETSVPGAQGIEDAFDVFVDVNSDGVMEPFGTFFYGGFNCAGATGNTPFAQFYTVLYTTSCASGRCSPSICQADLFPNDSGDGILNFFDLNAYLTLFNSNDSSADLFPASNPDGLINFFDLTQYLALYAAGCP